MNEGALIGRSISFPPRVVDGRVAWSEGADNVRESIRIILMTEPGERLRLQEFGGGLSQVRGPGLFARPVHHRGHRARDAGDEAEEPGAPARSRQTPARVQQRSHSC